MSTKLEDQIRGYAEFFGSTLERVEPGVVIDGRAEFVPSRSSRPRGLLAAAAAAVIVLLVIGGGGWLMRGEPMGSPAGPVAPAPTPTTLSPTSPLMTGAVIYPLGKMWSVTVGGPGFIAVGNSAGVPVVWTSPDGVEWSEAFADDAVGEMREIMAVGPGFVAVGVSRAAPAVWSSHDGMEWIQTFTGDVPGLIDTVWSEASSLVATGYVECGTDCEPDQAAWVSQDGLAWKPIDHTEADRLKAEATGAAAVVRDLEGGHMAMTLDGEWVSESGIDAAMVVEGAPVETVVPLEGGRFVAVGRRCGFSVAVWLSDEGEKWSFVHLETLDSLIIFDATVRDGLFVMVGWSDERTFAWAMPVEDLQALSGQEQADSC